MTPAESGDAAAALRPRVVVLGSLNVDLVTRVERHPRPGETLLGDGLLRLAGGKGANQAMAAARAGASVRMVGAVGHDEAGAAFRHRLDDAGIDTTTLSLRPEHPTGTALIAVDADGENTIIVVPGANGTVAPDALGTLEALDQLGPADVLLVQLEIPLDTVATACRQAYERGARVVLNIAPYADLPADVVATADPLVANEHEAEHLDRAGLVPTSLLVTLGAAGARWGELELPATEVPAEQVQDTTGAGDAFCGVLAAALARGLDDEAALRSALDAGAQAVRHHGAQPDPALY